MPTSGNFDFSADSYVGGPYLFYVNESTIVLHGGNLELPVAYQTPPAAGNDTIYPVNQRQPMEIVAASSPYGYREVNFHMVRWGAPQQLPDPTPGPNEALLFLSITTAAPILQPDATTYVYEARGFYRYALGQPLWPPLDGLPGTSTPASTDIALNNPTTPDQFDPDLVDHTEGSNFFGTGGDNPMDGDIWSG